VPDTAGRRPGSVTPATRALKSGPQKQFVVIAGGCLIASMMLVGFPAGILGPLRYLGGGPVLAKRRTRGHLVADPAALAREKHKAENRVDFVLGRHNVFHRLHAIRATMDGGEQTRRSAAA
jgi:hypothetical protein